MSGHRMNVTWGGALFVLSLFLKKEVIFHVTYSFVLEFNVTKLIVLEPKISFYYLV